MEISPQLTQVYLLPEGNFDSCTLTLLKNKEFEPTAEAFWRYWDIQIQITVSQIHPTTV